MDLSAYDAKQPAWKEQHDQNEKKADAYGEELRKGKFVQCK